MAFVDLLNRERADASAKNGSTILDRGFARERVPNLAKRDALQLLVYWQQVVGQSLDPGVFVSSQPPIAFMTDSERAQVMDPDWLHDLPEEGMIPVERANAAWTSYFIAARATDAAGVIVSTRLDNASRLAQEIGAGLASAGFGIVIVLVIVLLLLFAVKK